MLAYYGSNIPVRAIFFVKTQDAYYLNKPFLHFLHFKGKVTQTINELLKQ